MKFSFFSILLCTLLFSVGCKKSKTNAPLVCLNGGTYSNGACLCPAGYSGVQCEIIDSCQLLNCGAHGHCYNEVLCICDAGWGGAHCDSMLSTNCLVTDCGAHGYCENAQCVCDAGWVGYYCDIPIDSYPGFYHMTGHIQGWSINDTVPQLPIPVDDTIQIIKINEYTLSIYGRQLFHDYNQADTTDWVIYSLQDNNMHASYSVRFTRVFNDSAYYASSGGGLGGGSTTTLRGNKIHQ